MMLLIEGDSAVLQRASGAHFDADSRKLHPDGYKALLEAQQDLLAAADSVWDKQRPIITFNSITRSVKFQDELASRNRKIRTDAYPNGVPTATAGSSLHNFGLAVDIDTRDTMRRINEAKIDLSFQEFRQFLAGYYIMGIASEPWHFNLMLNEEWASKEGWQLREHLYAKYWTGLEEDAKKELLLNAGAAGSMDSALSELASAFQMLFPNTLEMDGIAGPKTLRAAFCATYI